MMVVFPLAAFADNRAAVRFGRRFMTVEARLDSRNGGLEEWVFDQYTFRALHRFRHRVSFMAAVEITAADR